MELTQHEIASFQETLWRYYTEHGRGNLPWRQPEANSHFDPYKIMVSEIMLQQTQVSRAIPKYNAFLTRFPTLGDLASAQLGEVLKVWQGLGYNRRAKFLWQAAQEAHRLNVFPDTMDALVKLPGVGVNTAGAILAYAFNRPVEFIETNIRTVYIHHFFTGTTDVADKEIRKLVSQTLDMEQAREFYWALMDYGSYLKTIVGNLNRSSKTYKKQSKFHGSRRQIRGQVIRLLGVQPHDEVELMASISDDRLTPVLEELLAEQMIRKRGGRYSL